MKAVVEIHSRFVAGGLVHLNAAVLVLGAEKIV